MGQMHAPVNPDEIQQWVSFVLDEQTYAIDVLRVREVLKPIQITPVAGSPHHVLGIINIRGNIVTVIDARRRLNLPVIDVKAQSRIILVELEDQVIGVMVDRVGEVLQLSQSQIEAAPNAASSELSGNVKGLATRGDELVEIIDLKKLLAA